MATKDHPTLTAKPPYAIATFRPDAAREIFALPTDTRFFVGEQTHGNHIALVDEFESRDDVTVIADTDALISVRPGIALAVRTADCLPILIVDTRRHTIAAIHAGWRGLAAGIVTQTVEKMIARGSRGDDLIAWIAPAIQKCCFAVGADVAAALGRGNETYLDLPRIAADELTACGILPKNLDISTRCTCCEAATFPSHRREGAARDSVCWTVIAVAAMTNAP